MQDRLPRQAAQDKLRKKTSSVEILLQLLVVVDLYQLLHPRGGIRNVELHREDQRPEGAEVTGSWLSGLWLKSLGAT